MVPGASLPGGACSCPTTRARLRSSKDWRRSASDRACTSGQPVSAVCTTWSKRWWTTPSTRPWPAGSIFETTEWNFETLSRRLQEMAFLVRGLAIVLTDQRPAHINGEPRVVTYQYDGGIADFVRYLNGTKDPVHGSVIEFGGEGAGISAEIAMQWNASYAESVYTFANTINTAEGGTHEEGFRSALTTIVNNYARDQKLVREKDERPSGEDVREGLAAIISVKLANPQFEGQTK